MRHTKVNGRLELARIHVKNGDGYDAGFDAWLVDNWSIYCEFERRARAWKAAGHEHGGAKMFVETIRYETGLREKNGLFSLNNNVTASLARLCVAMNPRLRGLFEFRERRAA